ncbi:MAG: hypothetical protein ACQCXQ_01755, partial [Verrucomicrobiales bacterium]
EAAENEVAAPEIEVAAPENEVAAPENEVAAPENEVEAPENEVAAPEIEVEAAGTVVAAAAEAGEQADETVAEVSGVADGGAVAAEKASESAGGKLVRGLADLKPKVSLSHVEKIGLIVLAVVLLVGGAGGLLVSLNRLPKETNKVSRNDFPIKGMHLSVDSAVSYWRAPTLDDACQIGTELLPVLEVTMGEGKGAIRVQFRNEDREIIGDVRILRVSKSGLMSIPATAGFEDLGMHAAYRTGESDPWTILVSEGPDVGAESSEFTKLFEMSISTDRR